MITACPGLTLDDPPRLTVQIDFPRARLAVAKIERADTHLAPPERPDLIVTTSRVAKEADNVRLGRPLRAFSDQPVQFGMQAAGFVPGQEPVEPTLRVPAYAAGGIDLEMTVNLCTIQDLPKRAEIPVGAACALSL